MGEVIVSVLAGLLRYALAGVVTWAITNGIATEEQTTKLIAALASGIGLVGWLIYRKYKDRVMVLTALAQPKGTTMEDLKKKIAIKETVPADTPNDAVPTVKPSDAGSVKPRS